MASLPNETPQRPVALHRDNLLGVCACLGEIARIDPLIFRLAFLVAMLGFSFEMTIGTYLVAAAAFYIARR